MSGQQILTAARLSFTTENGCLILILAGLIFAESFVEKEFQCICRQGYGETIFSFYLGIPAFIAFTVTFCILRELTRQESDKKRESDEETQNQESNTEAQNQQSIRVLVLKSLIPSCFWILLFFCDGRYVACVATTLQGEHADNNAPSPWEWCNKNRTLTDDQRKAEDGYIWSKIAGFAALFICSIIILVYECRNQCKQRTAATQTETGQGTAGTQPGAEQEMELAPIKSK